jgi:hypothetical protein
MSEAGPSDAPAPAQATKADLSAHGMRGLVHRFERVKGPIVAVAAVGAVLSGLLGYWNVYRTVRESTVPLATSSFPADAAPLSIVVLPFANLTGDARALPDGHGLRA